MRPSYYELFVFGKSLRNSKFVEVWTFTTDFVAMLGGKYCYSL